MAFIRPPAVAGQFYPAQPEALIQAIRGYTDSNHPRNKALGCIAPHAGYMYSGQVAGAVYSRIDIPRRIVILCPNHTGYGEPLSIISSGFFRTPLGDTPIDTDLALAIRREMPMLTEDPMAQAREHSLEVQLPFLQVLKPDFTFVPITVGIHHLPYLQELGKAISTAIGKQSEPVLIVASSDMNHYETDSLTRVKDRKAIDEIIAMNPEGLHQVVNAEHISMCGVGPTVSMLTAVSALNPTRAELIQYATSGDVSGDRDRVVGYAGIIVS